EWTGAVMLLIFAIFIVPYYLKYRLTTMPEYLERRFDHRSRMYFSIISITVNILIDIAGALYASSLFLRGIFPDIDLFVFVIIMAVITGLYTAFGGLRAVVATDSVQAVLLTVGSAVVAWTVFSRLGSDRKSTRLNSSHVSISYAVFCLKKKIVYSIYYIGFDKRNEKSS